MKFWLYSLMTFDYLSYYIFYVYICVIHVPMEFNERSSMRFLFLTDKKS